MDRKLHNLEARDIRDDQDVISRNMAAPALIALPEIEREVFRLHLEGISGVDISNMTGLRRDEICRILQGVRGKLEFLQRFQQYLFGDPQSFKRFMRLSGHEFDPPGPLEST
jgi:DNA-directed RNA polymerase specialized sigma24 family protein